LTNSCPTNGNGCWADVGDPNDQANHPSDDPTQAYHLTVAVGRALIGPYAMTFELLAVLLVIALLGALYFARSEG